jgi:hypothetical protein
MGRIIETGLQLEEFKAKLIKATSKRSQNNPIHTILNIYQMMEKSMGTGVVLFLLFKSMCYTSCKHLCRHKTYIIPSILNHKLAEKSL